MSRTDADTTIQELKDYMVAFRNERGWDKHHTPKNTAMSIAIEAAELMELFQWDGYSDGDKQKMADELADILSYVLSFADVTGIDIAGAYYAKMERVKRKYPTEIFNPASDDRDAHLRIKQSYRQHGEPGTGA